MTDLRSMKNSMSKEKKEESRLRTSYRLKQAGSTFPDDEETETSTSSESGNESAVSSSSKKSRIKKKVKSGAKVKRRSVVRTELWPHTIANEEDGEDTTCEDISLAKFLKCFGIIMTTCKGKEAKGRPVLLLALTSMLEYLPWAKCVPFTIWSW